MPAFAEALPTTRPLGSNAGGGAGWCRQSHLLRQPVMARLTAAASLTTQTLNAGIAAGKNNVYAGKDGTVYRYNRQSGDSVYRIAEADGSLGASLTPTLQRQQQMRNQGAQRTAELQLHERKLWRKNGWRAHGRRRSLGAEARLRCLSRDVVDRKSEAARPFCEASIRPPPVRESSVPRRLFDFCNTS